jgi:hypothetical protein
LSYLGELAFNLGDALGGGLEIEWTKIMQIIQNVDLKERERERDREIEREG